MLKVFLVEDEIIMREGIRKIIDWEKEGFEFAGETSDGELAYPMIKKIQPDILITDIRMPFMDGLELSSIVKKEFPHIKIIILSGYNEFEYAKKAIGIGVTDYLLKPISPNKLLEAVNKVAALIEKEQSQKSIIEQYQQDMEENTNLESLRLFNELVTKEMPVTEALSKGESLGIDLGASAYTVLLFKLIQEDNADSFSDIKIQSSDKIEQFVKQFPDIISFVRESEEWIFLIKGESEAQIEEQIRGFVEGLIETASQFETISYFGGIGKTVLRLRDLRISYREANRAFSVRFFADLNHIIRYDEVHKTLSYEGEEIDIDVVDTEKMDRKVITGFLKSGIEDEIAGFIEEYFISLGLGNVKSYLFRQYITMDVYFSVIGFLEELGCENEQIKEKLGDFRDIASHISNMDTTKEYLENLIRKVVTMREASSVKKYADIIQDAKLFIEENYEKEITLLTISSRANMSPSYFSSIFRQETGRTFVEYLTDVRMEKAKELLVCTNLKNVDIGFKIGYKDAHYFSYIFKKTQNCTPKEYRMRRKKSYEDDRKV